MTLIQCFCPSLVENITNCLRLRPEKLILLGDQEEMREPAERYAAIAGQQGIPMQVVLCNIGGMILPDIYAALRELLEQEQDCVIDLTGSSELVALAVGAVLVRTREHQRISVQKYDARLDVDIDCDGDGQVLPGVPARLSVQELIALHGGTIHPAAWQLPKNLRAKDLARLWAVVAEDPKAWNRRITILREFESRSDSQTHIFLPLRFLRDSIHNFEEKEEQLRWLLGAFERRGVIYDSSSRDYLEYEYTEPLFRYCTEKAGNVLEVKTLLEARSLFTDSAMSVNIDWDGILYEPQQRKAETRNEIDVVLMQGTTPLFISCKNGSIGDEELYKLHTVATRFGGPNARKMLIATDLDRKSPAADRAFAQRAWDMKICLVPEAAQLEPEEWEQAFRSAMQ